MQVRPLAGRQGVSSLAVEEAIDDYNGAGDSTLLVKRELCTTETQSMVGRTAVIANRFHASP